MVFDSSIDQRLTAFEGTLGDMEDAARRKSGDQDLQLQLTGLEMRMAALAARMSKPRKGDRPDLLNEEYMRLAEQVRKLKS
jgi:hypothetical protein